MLSLQIASSSLLKLGIETEKDVKARESTYLLLDLVGVLNHSQYVVGILMSLGRSRVINQTNNIRIIPVSGIFIYDPNKRR